MKYSFFATCPKGIEGLLADELTGLGAAGARETVAGVHFEGELELAYRACLWSRLANRILLVLATFPAADAAAVYAGTRETDWSRHMAPDDTLAIDFTGTSPTISNSHFGAQKTKDAIADQFREATGRRPSVDTDRPSLRVNARLWRDTLTLSLDLSGDSLHRRGYRAAQGAAPLKENLAAAVLVRAGWPDIARQGGPLLDPLCGSGTFLVEGGMIAADIAPGLLRRHFGFMGWRGHSPGLWQDLQAEAEERRRMGLARTLPDLRGYDADPRAVLSARTHIERAGLDAVVSVSVRELARLARPTHAGPQPGLLVANPPYGERQGDAATLAHLYRHLGRRLREQFAGWQAAVFTGNPELGKNMGLRARKQYSFFNGALPCKLLMFTVEPEWFVDAPPPSADRPRTPAAIPAPAPSPAAGQPAAGPATADAPGAGAEMLANRLRKNLRILGKWARREGNDCYRIYDADMKEYAFAIDRYGDWLHVQEYAPPPTVDPASAERRLREALAVIPAVLGVPADHLALKQRRRQRGLSQYEKQGEQGRFVEVREDDCRFLVNLTDYLDTGLFLDHRPLRRMIRGLAANKRFLNLFCYTAAATVNAAAGGARNTTSIDMSRTYLNWARRNLALNGLSESLHRLVQADCRTWLAETEGQYDLILMDPPTFSNSKRMAGVLDAQRDHPGLIRLAMRHLAPGGRLYFSSNNRHFKLDEAALSDLALRNITPRTIDRDFARDPRIHTCWEIHAK